MRSHAVKAKAGPAKSSGSAVTAHPSKAVRNILAAGVQPKLKIGAVNDPAELEADRVADQVMRMPDPKSVNSGPPPDNSSGTGENGGSGDGLNPGGTAGPPTIRRKCTDCEDDEKVQRRKPLKSA